LLVVAATTPQDLDDVIARFGFYSKLRYNELDDTLIISTHH